MREIIAIQEVINREKQSNESKLCFEILQVDAILAQKTMPSVDCENTEDSTFVPTDSEKKTELLKHKCLLKLYK